MIFTRQAVHVLRRQFVNRHQVRFSSTKKSFFQEHALNIIGLPACAAILFFLLPSFTPGEIHSIDYYDKLYLEEQKERERKRREAQQK